MKILKNNEYNSLKEIEEKFQLLKFEKDVLQFYFTQVVSMTYITQKEPDETKDFTTVFNLVSFNTFFSKYLTETIGDDSKFPAESENVKDVQTKWNEYVIKEVAPLFQEKLNKIKELKKDNKLTSDFYT